MQMLESPTCAGQRRGRRGRAVSLIVPRATWQSLRQAMLASRRRGDEEVLGFLFCARHRTKRHDRYLARHWIVPSPDDFAHQSAGGLVLKQAFYLHLLTTYIAQGLHMVHFHTHPGAQIPVFSTTDDRDERAQSAALANLPGAPRLLSGVFNQTMEAGIVRIWSGETGVQRRVILRHDWIPELPEQRDAPPRDAALFDRQRIFGEPVQRRLGQLSVALIGCGGIGAPFAEQLARLGVRRWTLVDDDRIETSNLHRLPFATHAMAMEGEAKVDYAAGLIRRFWNDDARIVTIRASIDDPRAQQRAAEADLIVVATDNHASRLVAQQLALRALRPLLCLGTQIDQRPGEASPRIYSRVTMPPLGGGWCLPCAQVISLTTAAEEQADPLTRAQLAAGGYLPQVAAPAVYWVNNISAAMGARLVHGVIAGFIDPAAGVDDLFDLAGGAWMPVSHETTPDCFFCGAGGWPATE